MSSHNRGGQKRTIATVCGWTASGSPREANGKLKLHMRVCETCKGIDLSGIEKPTKNGNGYNGLSVSKNGNLIKPAAFKSVGKFDGEEVEISSNTMFVKDLIELMKPLFENEL